ncbi:heavy-metal-associated domain-containing protein [Clostridium sp. 19966]|uniref:heavy-metal-associated domain-containing protein n=1 Tax=Clostridium sp. 19966 TaxID=2768166 RepID=UPI0028DD5F30|nr:cation transporter [Clostridium sp. 19966]MDT8718642.1 heavy-metal-associated domain-containing protein [Clostridium sp. 19966]
MKKKILVEGMSCGHCVSHVKEALSELKRVTSVNVNLDFKTVIIEATSDIADEEIKSAIDEVGYDVVRIENL